ncbi:hypothetical protein BC941DRAFT_487154 [Chlamydoabsidia padenii]|nr:hypothetical protein BC941DRAFT_487149 [Chlamydoabsidia padenii]KAI8329459.1 hypothetical protein BC941DRAFT_487154 [Chlamydoabsidia padenii]
MAFIARSYVSNMESYMNDSLENALRQLTGETSDCWGRLSGLTEVDRQPAIVDDTSHEKEDEYDTGTNAGNDKDNNDTDNKDPGVTEVFFASDSSDLDAYTSETDMMDEPILAARKDKRHQVLKLSAAEFYCSSGYNKTTTKIKNWKDLHGISTIESTMGSLKIASIARIQDYIVNKMISLDRLLLFYNDDFQKVRFFNYRGKQKAAREMVQIFVEAEHKYERLSNRGNCCFVQRQRSKNDGSWKKRRCQFDKISQGIPSIQPKIRKWKKHPFEESNKIPLLCVGDGKFDRRSFRRKPRGLVKAFRKVTKLAQRQHLMFVVDVNEQYTSKAVKLA